MHSSSKQVVLYLELVTGNLRSEQMNYPLYGSVQSISLALQGDRCSGFKGLKVIDKYLPISLLKL